MKLSKSINISDFLIPIVALALIVPNVMVAVYGDVSLSEWLAIVALPLGVYLTLMSIFRKSYIPTFIAFPVMVLAAFQIVIISLYDSACPIGVDMFLNVVTTNSGEVNELLSGLIKVIIVVACIYLTPIILAVVAAYSHSLASKSILKVYIMSAVASLILGVVGIGCNLNTNFKIKDDLFPVNAIVDLKGAVTRYDRIHKYNQTSDRFSYKAKSQVDYDKGVYIAVIGETSRADNWSLMGYERNTNPLLSLKRDSLFAFDNVFSESNTTHKAVPMLLTTFSSKEFEDSIYRHKSIISAFKECGFHTVFISNQDRNHSFIESYEGEADLFSPVDTKKDRYVLPLIDSLISVNEHDKLMVVVHLYGSHYKYSDRYEPEHAVFLPDDIDLSDRQSVVNAYDNTIVNTDYVLNELIKKLNTFNLPAGMIYCSDHGEDLMDDNRNRFLHASPYASYEQLHVPLLIYLNDSYLSKYPEKTNTLKNHKHKLISSSNSYSHSLLDMAGISTPYLNVENSLFSNKFKEKSDLTYLNDRNEAIPLVSAGLDSIDFLHFKKHKQLIKSFS